MKKPVSLFSFGRVGCMDDDTVYAFISCSASAFWLLAGAGAGVVLSKKCFEQMDSSKPGWTSIQITHHSALSLSLCQNEKFIKMETIKLHFVNLNSD